MNEGVNMSNQEINRVNVISDICQGKISQSSAAEKLNLSVRQVQRLQAAYLKHGMAALKSKHKDKVSNNKLPDVLKSRVREIITQEIYIGFGPTLMKEKLEQLHSIKISRETVRQLMIELAVWKVNKKSCPVIHQQRLRRARFGELIQLDGSPHPWFEDRGNPCCLIVLIDDATGRTHGKFFESERTEAYMITVREYIKLYGIPLTFYPDKFSVFRINRPGCLKKELITQFGRACKELGIELICANSPQAKGRVERVNKTLQDRLVKEMRLAGISTIEDANQFLPYFWDKFNKQFKVPPKNTNDAHRHLAMGQNLDDILCLKNPRKVSKNLEIQYNNKIYQLISDKPSRVLRGATIMVLERLGGKIILEYQGKHLPYKLFGEQETNGKEVTSKEIDRFLNHVSTYKKVSNSHPWKQEGRAEAKRREFQAVEKEVAV